MRILATPLDWGLGHSTRLIPIIERHIEAGDEVLIAGSGRSLKLLRSVFPELKVLKLRSFSPRFSSIFGQWLMIALQSPIFLLYIYYERISTWRIVRKYGIDEIISDNRYGVRSSRCRSSIITHQLSPIPWSGSSGLINKLLSKIIGRWISRFDVCLVPDFASDGKGLSGRLSVSKYVSCPIEYIGMLSRLSAVEASDNVQVDVLAIISGPEPQRTEFEHLLLLLSKNNNRKYLIINGKVNGCQQKFDNVTIVGNAMARELASYIKSARTIICRSGYSTLMDLMTLDRRAILVPTPGQAEQEYLAERCKEFGFESVEQKNFVDFCTQKFAIA